MTLTQKIIGTACISLITGAVLFLRYIVRLNKETVQIEDYEESIYWDNNDNHDNH